MHAHVRASRNHDCCVGKTLSAASKTAIRAWIDRTRGAYRECRFRGWHIRLLRVQASFSFPTALARPGDLASCLVVSACPYRDDPRRCRGCSRRSQVADMPRGDSIAPASYGWRRGEQRSLNEDSWRKIPIALTVRAHFCGALPVVPTSTFRISTARSFGFVPSMLVSTTTPAR